MGGQAYYGSSGLQDYVDIWPFQIFEGSKLFLNSQIGKSFLGSTRVGGKIVLPSFTNFGGRDFNEYFFKWLVRHPMFEVITVNRNLSERTIFMLGQITPDHVTSELTAVIGEIVARLFALSCLENENSDGAVSLLNQEICSLALNFRI